MFLRALLRTFRIAKYGKNIRREQITRYSVLLCTNYYVRSNHTIDLIPL
jgi:hypothetical protein